MQSLNQLIAQLNDQIKPEPLLTWPTTAAATAAVIPTGCFTAVATAAAAILTILLQLSQLTILFCCFNLLFYLYYLTNYHSPYFNYSVLLLRPFQFTILIILLLLF